jgi:DNA-binding NarL/FixJ family response regulator
MNARKQKELQIITLIQQGKANKEIAAEIGKTTATVKDIIHKLLRKHNCKNRTELAMKFTDLACRDAV